MVKEHVDVFGPRQPAQFGSTTSKNLLDLFPFKATYWETSTLLHADWTIVRSEMKSEQRSYVESISRLARLVEIQRASAVSLRDLDVSHYDIVISLEPCLSPLQRLKRTRNWFYFHNEHSNVWYDQSRQMPYRPYAAFLDHMCGTSTDARGSFCFPYLRDPKTMRASFPKMSNNKPVAWIDARSIMLEANGNTQGTWTTACDRYLQKLSRESGIHVITRDKIYRDFYNVPAVSDAADFLENMSRADFYIGVGVGARGAGQTLCDAASLGLVCFGTTELAYHAMICPSDRLCISISDALKKAIGLYASPDRMKAIVEQQDTALRQEFQHAPLQRLFRRAGIISGRERWSLEDVYGFSTW